MSENGEIVEKKSFAETLGIIIIIFAFLIYTTWSFAYVGSVLWQWFIVPFGMKPISIAHAWGVSLLVRLWTFVYKYEDENESWKSRFRSALMVFLYPWFTLLLAKIAQMML